MLYALVAAGFVVIVLVLTIAGAASGVVPGWWSVALGIVLLIGATWMAGNWRKTGATLVIAIGTFVVWLVGTVILAT